MTSPQIVRIPAPDVASKYTAWWVGGPPERELESIWGRLRHSGINVIKQVEFPSNGTMFTVPPDVTLLLMNKDVISEALVRMVRSVVDETRTKLAWVNSEWSSTYKLLLSQKILTESAPPKASAAVEVARPKLVPVASSSPDVIELLMQMSEDEITKLSRPRTTRDMLLAVRKSMLMHEQAKPVIEALTNLDDEAMLAVVENISRLVAERFVLAAKCSHGIE